MKTSSAGATEPLTVCAVHWGKEGDRCQQRFSMKIRVTGKLLGEAGVRLLHAETRLSKVIGGDLRIVIFSK